MTPRFIGCFTDVPIGYGTPQIQYLLRSLSQHYGNRSHVLICEPRSTSYPDVHGEMPEFTFRGIEPTEASSGFWFADGGRGQARLAEGVRAWLDATRPDLLLLAGFNALRYLDVTNAFSSWRPYLVHYALEFLARRDMDEATAERHRQSASVVDLLLFSEANRRRHYNREFGTGRIAQALVLNVPPRRRFPVSPTRERNGRILVQSASIQWELTYPEYLATTRRPDIPIDVYGLIYPGPARVLDAPDAASAFGVRYRGAVSNRQLASLRSQYSYSFVAWAPHQFNTLYACPNKLFESIASGVPPIAAPHPQCAEILGRYECGILMRDWSFEAFCEALDTARGLLGTSRYRDMVHNCLRAHETELNWERQFERIAERLPHPGPAPRRARGRRLVLVAPRLESPGQPAWAVVSVIVSRARDAGFEPLVVTSRRFLSPPTRGVRTIPVLPEQEALDTVSFEAALEGTLAREGIGRRDQVACWLPPAYASRLSTWLAVPSRRRGARWLLLLEPTRSTDRSGRLALSPLAPLDGAPDIRVITDGRARRRLEGRRRSRSTDAWAAEAILAALGDEGA